MAKEMWLKLWHYAVFCNCSFTPMNMEDYVGVQEFLESENYSGKVLEPPKGMPLIPITSVKA